MAESEEDCFAIIRQFHSYMPSHSDKLPMVRLVPEDSGSRLDRILEILPERKNMAYDMNKILATIVDGGDGQDGAYTYNMMCWTNR